MRLQRVNSGSDRGWTNWSSVGVKEKVPGGAEQGSTSWEGSCCLLEGSAGTLGRQPWAFYVRWYIL